DQGGTVRKLLSTLLTRLWTNWITILGSVIATLSGLAIFLLLGSELAELKENAYSSSFLLLSLPILFAGGLVLIPVGLFVDRRRRNRQALRSGAAPEDPVAAAFRVAIEDRSTRRRILFLAVATVVNIVLFSYAGHKSMAYMDSPRFCGTTCHIVMKPEWEAYNRSPHSRVACVQCHIGSGASWAGQAKIYGLGPGAAGLTHSYHTPVPSRVENMRPSRDTCEQCHWPQKFTGSQLRLFPHYKADEKNTPQFNAVLVHVGGQNPRTHEYEGIHWHASAEH